MDEYKDEAEKWMLTSESTFILSKVNEEEREIIFDGKLDSNSLIRFKITCPTSDDLTENFVVSSEDEKTELRLFEVNDYSAMKKRTLSQILNMVQVILCPENETENDFEDEDGDESGEESEEDIDDGYVDGFIDESETVEEEQLTSPNPHEIADDDEDKKFSSKYGCQQASLAVLRLKADFKKLKKSAREGNFGISGGPREDNLFLWDVQLSDFDSRSKLGIDIARYAKRYNEQPVVKLEMAFPSTYPMEPPFLRVLKPRFRFLTGHVTVGGSICMELLTRSGWSPSNDIESILVQVRAEIMSDTNARLDDKNTNVEYSAEDAKNAFRRMTHKYGWN